MLSIKYYFTKYYVMLSIKDNMSVSESAYTENETGSDLSGMDYAKGIINNNNNNNNNNSSNSTNNNININGVSSKIDEKKKDNNSVLYCFSLLYEKNFK